MQREIISEQLLIDNAADREYIFGTGFWIHIELLLHSYHTLIVFVLLVWRCSIYQHCDIFSLKVKHFFSMLDFFFNPTVQL